jgi:hypothetical protein
VVEEDKREPQGVIFENEQVALVHVEADHQGEAVVCDHGENGHKLQGMAH